MGGEGDVKLCYCRQVQLLWQDVEVAKNYKWCAIFRRAAEKGIHLIVQVAKGTWWTIDRHNVVR